MNRYLLIIPLCTAVLLSACDRLIEIAPPRTQIDADEVFTTNETAHAAVLRLYTDFTTTNIGFNSSLMGNISADEFGSVGTTFLPIYSNSIPVNHSVILSNIWYPYYQLIYWTNAIINGLADNKGVDDKVKKELSAEAKAMRAYCYFHLLNFFGEVPLLTTTDVQTNLQAERAEVAAIWQLIDSDLTTAVSDLPVPYPSAERARINRSAATALQARVKLYLRQWQEAEQAASTVINNTDYQLESDLSTLFLTDSRETIWQGWTERGYTTMAIEFVPASATATPTYSLSTTLWSAFAANDKRAQYWISHNTVAGNTYHYPAKYKRRTASSGLPREHMVVLRLAEQYLIRAEARAQQSNKLMEAVDDLDAIRLRAGLQPLADTGLPLTKENVLTAIEQERFRELFAEGSHRWFDLKRTGRIDAVMTAAKGDSWRTTAALYPIPKQERLKNTKLTQNDGYDD